MRVHNQLIEEALRSKNTVLIESKGTGKSIRKSIQTKVRVEPTVREIDERRRKRKRLVWLPKRIRNCPRIRRAFAE